MKRKILIASMYDRQAIAPQLQRLSRHAELLVCDELGRSLTEEEIIPLLEGVDAVIAAEEPYNERVFKSAPRLEIIARDGVGLDSIDLQAATRHGVIVVNAPAVHESVADLTFGLIVAVVRKIRIADQGVRAGLWTNRDRYLSTDVNGKTLGILGFGRVGRAVARRAAGFNMTILAHRIKTDTREAQELGVQLVGLDVLLRSSDILCIHVPLTPQTCGMIGKDAISQMKDGAFLINMARGRIVDQDVMVAALKSGKLAGVGLDVLAVEPPEEDNPLLRLENVVLTPHMGSDTLDTFARVLECAADDILLHFVGKRPVHIVNPEVLRHKRFKENKIA